MRGDEPSPTRSAVLVRLATRTSASAASSACAYLDETDNIAELLDYTIRTYMPDVWRDSAAERAVAFLEEVVAPRRRHRCRLDGRRLRPRRAQHRQHQRHRRELRLRPLALPAALDPTFTAAYFDDTGLYAYRPPARHAAVEPDAARRMPAALRRPDRAGNGAARLRAEIPERLQCRHAAPPRPAIGRRGAGHRPRACRLEVHAGIEGPLRAGLLRLVWRPEERDARRRQHGGRPLRVAGLRPGPCCARRARARPRHPPRPHLFHARKCPAPC